MRNEGIVRNRLKIDAVVANAIAFLDAQREFESFDRYVWQFVDGKPFARSKRKTAVSRSELMSKSLKKRGFKFVGPTICFAFIQAVGLLNDHSPGCFRYRTPSS
jgi:DNA-3-methyladenine glycosylase I